MIIQTKKKSFYLDFIYLDVIRNPLLILEMLLNPLTESMQKEI